MFLKKSITTLLLLCCSYASLANSPSDIPMQQFNQALHDQLPAHILNTGEITVVNDGTVPPFVMYTEQDRMEGASVDLLTAVSQILGINVKHERVVGLSALIIGVKSERYDMAIGPVGDNPERQKSNDFIAYATSYTAFAVPKGNPLKINSLTDTCGKRIAVLAGSNGENKLKAYSEICIKEGRPAANMLSFKDTSTSILAVKSNRADALYTGMPILGYYASLDKDYIELTGIKEIDGMPERYYSALVAKNSPLGPILLSAFQQLFDNGTYMAIMKKWGLEHSTIDAPGINLAK